MKSIKIRSGATEYYVKCPFCGEKYILGNNIEPCEHILCEYAECVNGSPEDTIIPIPESLAKYLVTKPRGFVTELQELYEEYLDENDIQDSEEEYYSFCEGYSFNKTEIKMLIKSYSAQLYNKSIIASLQFMEGSSHYIVFVPDFPEKE